MAGPLARRGAGRDRSPMPRPRAWVWLQLIVGWLPVWALYTTLIATAHPDTPLRDAAIIAVRAIGAAALLGLLVFRLTQRLPWPRQVTPRFVALHLVAAAGYSAAWILLTSAMESIVRWRLVLVIPPTGLSPFLILGVWFYVMVAAVAYATQAAERAARAEAAAARSQLAALRSQLHPHFLFNALHAVVQLIPREPARASDAALQLAGLLRTTIGEDRDLVSLADERAFVERYLALERMRFGDRLRVEVDIGEESEEALIPSFALLTLVENAIRHGAAPRVEATDISIVGRATGHTLTLSVRDSGAGADPERLAGTEGTGLSRLRERLAVLYGDRARLEITTGRDRGFVASLTVPQERGDNGAAS